MTIRAANTIIAGVNKAGTTSLFVSLQAHPQVATSAVKETRYFLPARYGRPLEPPSVYAAYFAGDDRPVRLEATPSYFYGGTPLVAEIVELLGPGIRIIVVLREPVSRLVSFFTFQKARLRLPEEMTLEEYLAVADGMHDDDFGDPENEKWFGFRGGCYADYLPSWASAFGDNLRILFFDDLTRDPRSTLADVATWLGIDADRLGSGDLSSENRTIGFRSRGFQRVALTINDRLERLLRRHPDLKRRLRSAYYRVNGRAAREGIPAAVRTELEERYREPNARLAVQLRDAGVTKLPGWLTAPVSRTSPTSTA
ncbi:MAG: sulfotransferase domain-containing protein [Actinobacteria bacterium]|nr:sulfotransferase domain-containing protein [Actinomycetota bacterium]